MLDLSAEVLNAFRNLLQDALLAFLGQVIDLAINSLFMLEEEGTDDGVVALEGEVGEGVQKEYCDGHAEDHVEELVEEEAQEGSGDLRQ